MTDVFDAETRSRVMRSVKGINTTPERTVRTLLHATGYRYRLHRRDLPGKPDIVFPVRHKVIFVHGCFWHGHNCARGARIPKSNVQYWKKKIARNKQRDARHLAALNKFGWKTLVIWECEMNNRAKLTRRLNRFLL